MAAKWTADWANRLFILKAGVVDLDVEVDLYSDWKEEVKLVDNVKHAVALRAVGGDPISDTQDLGATFFLVNNWKIRPQEADHELLITGNIFSDPAGESIVIPTLGTFTVLVTNRVSNLVDSSVARLDLTQLLKAVYIDTLNGVSGTAEGVGTPTNPSNNIVDARIIADRDNLRAYIIVGSAITLDQDHIGWSFRGERAVVNCGGFNVSGAQFIRCEVTGTMVAPSAQIVIDEGRINNLTNFWGIIGRSLFEGTLLLAPGDTFISIAGSNIADPAIQSIIDMDSNGSDLVISKWSGDIRIDNSVASSNIALDIDSGLVVLDSTCIGGDIVIRGIGVLTDNSGVGFTVDKIGFIEGVDVRLTRKILSNRLETDPVTGVLTVYDDDDTILVTCPVFEDIAGTQPYKGQGAERRNKLV